MALTPAEEDELMILLAQENLGDYVRATMDLEPARHHDLIIEGLEELEANKLDVLVINCPPGSAKSTYGSVAFPAWYLGRHPNHCIIAASHTQELAERFGRRVRNLVGSAEHATVFPGCTLSADSTAAGRWDTSQKGEYFAAGVGGSVTGRRADCVLFNTLVQSSTGIKEIQYLKPGEEVLSYAEHDNRASYRRVVAVAKREATEYWRIRTASGRVVEATGNHRFYVSGVWKTAETVAVGDVFLSSLCDAVTPDELRTGKEVSGEPELLTGVQLVVRDTEEQRCTRDGCSTGLQGMRRPDATEGQESGVFRSLQGCSCCRERGTTENCPTSQLRCVREAVSADEQHRAIEVLLDGLQECGARGSDACGVEPELATRQRSEQIQTGDWTSVQEGKACSDGAGWAQMCCVPVAGTAAGASHRREQCEQCTGERGDVVQNVPSESSCGGEVETFADPVALVERVREEATVFDIQVEGTACFFAGGVLVHNCAIIDDPVKSREDADSQTIREKQWAWWRDDLMTRMKPGGKIVLIMTRWHEDDLGGRLLEDLKTSGRRFRVISIKMEADDNDPLGRYPGEPLWPEWFTPMMLEEAKREPRTWSALYQQEPRPIGGGEFKQEWLSYWTRSPSVGQKVILVDPASGKSKTRGDFTSMWVLGVGQDGNDYVVDGIRDRLNLTERAEKLFELVRRWKPAAVGYEQYGLQADIEYIKIEQERQQYRFRVVELGGGMKKEDRIRRLIPAFQQGKLWMPQQMNRMMSDGHQRDIMQDFIQEYLAFPVASHDDAIDCLARSQEPEIRKFLVAPRQEQSDGYSVRSFTPFDPELGW